MKPIFYLSILLSSMLLTSCYRKFDLEEFLLEIFSLARRGSRWMGNRYALYIEYGSTARTNRKDSSFYPGIWNSLGGR